jgi:hypothetical protein
MRVLIQVKDSFSKIVPAAFLIFTYAVAVIFISSYHEVWKDEVGVFSIIQNHPNFLDALDELKQYGHPFLWYGILWLFYQLIHAPIALQAAHITIAVLAVLVFILMSPLTLIEKILFLLGYFPLYEYAVISRNYGVSMLLLFVVAALYAFRFQRMVLYCVAVFFLAQTHVLSWILALFLSVFLALESTLNPNSSQEMKVPARTLYISFTILITGLAISFFTSFPDKATRATHFLELSLPTLIQEFFKSFIQCFYASPKICDLFGIKNPLILSGLLCSFYFLILKRPIILMFFLAGFWAFNLFFNTVYFGAMRHYGLLYILLWTVFWILRSDEKKEGLTEDIRSKALKVLMLVLALPQIPMAFRAVEYEINMDYSASKSAATFISGDPTLKDAILISEPPEHIEALPYYVKNPINFPREGRFGTTVSMRKDAIKMEYSLDALLESAKALHQEYRKPVLIFLEPSLAGGGPGTRQWAHGLSFSCSKEALADLSKSTKKIAGFYGTISGENYEMFLIKG